MSFCTCWKDYQNECHKKDNGKWICVDKYKCVRHLERDINGVPKRKTMCVPKDAKEGDDDPRV